MKQEKKIPDNTLILTKEKGKYVAVKWNKKWQEADVKMLGVLLDKMRSAL